jgi:hypothetical protein
METQQDYANFIAACVRDAHQAGKVDWRDIRTMLNSRIAELPERERKTLLNLLALMTHASDPDCDSESIH